MELISVTKARSIWIFDFAELNPRGKRIQTEFLPWLKESYNFSKFPSSQDDLDETKALAFLDGSFQASPKDTVSIDLRIYSDGFVVDSRSSTKVSDDFMDEVLTRVAGDFDLAYNPKIVRKKLYASELNVRCKRGLQTLNPKLKDFANKLSKLMHSQVELSSVAFWSEQRASTPFSPFRFERKLNADFSENRYYSAAPLQTEDHLKLLDELEMILADNP